MGDQPRILRVVAGNVDGCPELAECYYLDMPRSRGVVDGRKITGNWWYYFARSKQKYNSWRLLVHLLSRRPARENCGFNPSGRRVLKYLIGVYKKYLV